MGQTRFFDAIKNGGSEDFAEFSETARKALGEIAEMYGIVRCEYSLSLPQSYYFDIKLPRDYVLFDNELKTENEPVRFEYPLSKGGTIEFVIYTLKNKSELSSDEMWLLEADFRQLYYIICELILELFCEEMFVTDFQTGISNSQAFMRFATEILKAGKASDYIALYFNIHNFKSVHRSLSYLEGNEVLKKYCKTVAEAVTKREIIARIGGDNFIALILDDNLDYFLDLLQNMIIFYEKDGKKLSFMFSATIGAAKFSDDQKPGDIMLNASVAYQSARENRSLFRMYDKQVSISLIERKIILSKFHKALSDGEFYVVYQPKVGVNDRKLRGAEVLVRWHHDGGDIMPGSFVSILEQDGCICTLDFFMLEEVCKLLKKVIDMGLEPVKISVNFSKRHLTNNKLVEEIAEVIDRYGVPHDCIEIELTESENSHNHGVMNEVVNELGALGIRTSIDDFGTGYSSLGMLRSLNLDELKIDKSFIPEAPVSSTDKSVLMLKGIISLAKSLGLTIVAEGVETNSQFELIEKLGCDIVQGFIFDKPLSESEFIDRIKRRDYFLG